MPTSIITTDDLREFKMEILEEMSKMLVQHKEPEPKRNHYLKSSEVLKILKISPGTLQTLRDSGRLPFVKVGGNIFYDMEDIQGMMNRFKVRTKRRKK